MKNPLKKVLVGALLAAGAVASASAFAWGGHHHHGGGRLFLGFNLGVPLYAPYYYSPAPVYYPAPVVVQQAPQIYTERPDVAAAPAPQQNYWYYCAASRGYYPYVQECPSGWERVPAAPAK